MSEVKKTLKYLERKAHYVDIRVENNHTNTIKAKDGELKDINYFITNGIGIRVFYDGCWGFTSVNNRKKVYEAGKKALKIAKVISKTKKKKEKFHKTPPFKEKFSYKPKKDFKNVDLSEKKKLVLETNKRALDFKEVKGATTNYLDSLREITFLNSEGSFITSTYPKILISNLSVAKEKITQQGFEKYGYMGGFEKVENKINIGKVSSKKAIKKLKAKSAPSGKHTMILNPELTGVLIHEAFGHAAEADGVLRGGSILKGKLGKKVASKKVTIIDDPTIHGYGFYKYDEEGVKGKKTTILKNGILESFLHSKETAPKFNTKTTGNGRAQNYSNIPIVRMSNTYLQKGDCSFEELLEGNGIYCKDTFGGQVNPITGYFSFTAQEGYHFQEGEIKDTLRDVTLSGNILSLLKNVERVGKDFKITHGGGNCVKNGQSVRVDFGGPHIKIKEVLVGGQI